MRSTSSMFSRAIIVKTAGLALLIFVILASVSQHDAGTVRAQAPQIAANVVTWQTLKAAQRVPTSYQGHAQTISTMQSGGATPLAMASADFDADGVADVVIGYASASGGILALHRGNLDAFAPQSRASWLAIAHQQFPPPFLPQATLLEVPEAPQFIVTGDFGGNMSILTGARGSQHLYLFEGNGKGGFSSPKAIALPGNLSALAAGEVGVREGKTDVVAAVETQQTSSVLVFKGSAGGLGQAPVSYPVPQVAMQLEIADLHGDGISDIAVLAGGEVLVVHPIAQAGADTTALIERVQTTGVRSIAVGGFLWDRHSRNQLAVLSQNGAVQILSPEQLDTRPFTAEERVARRTATLRVKLPSELNPQWSGQAESWNVVRSGSVSAPMSGNVRLMAASLAHARPLDLIVVDSSDSRLHVLPANTTEEGANDVRELTVETGDRPAAVLPLRVTVDGRRGLVMVGGSSPQPKTMAPMPDPTYTVNRFDDPQALVANAASYCNGGTNDCSFRQAVIKANSAAGADTIMLPAGTYTLTITGREENNAETGDIDVLDDLTIIGTQSGGTPTSIVQGCGGSSGISCTGADGATAWNDKFISTNKTGVSDANLSISNVIFQNSNNTNTRASGTFDYLGGAVDFFGCAPEGGGCSGGSGSLPVSSLSITNVTFHNDTAAGCEAGNDCGGGLDSEFGPTTVSGSSFASNSASLGRGGALTLVGAKETMTVSDTSFASNSSAQEGGAIYIDFQNTSGAGDISIHGSSFSSNTSGADGGGIYVNLGSGGNTTTATIDQLTTINANSAATRGGGVAFSGITGTAGSPGTTSLSINNTTITSNQANGASDDGGGGIFVLGGGTLNLQYSRIVGNTTAATGKPTGMSIEPGTGGSASTVSASENWWGCNGGPSAAPCDTAGIISGTGATLTDSPWIVLTLAANPTSVQAVAPNNTSALTADFLHDSSNASLSASNIGVLLNLPISFGATAGSISGAQATIQSDGTATATFTHDANCNASSASATVDTNPAPTVSAPITILCPDLTATKANSLGPSGAFTPLANANWTWTITVANSNASNSAPAVFAAGQTILSDNLPNTNISYGSATVGSFSNITNSANISCGISSNVLSCGASGAAVTIGAGGSFQVSFPATATAGGSYVNPAAGICAVNPGEVVPEFNFSNNSCSDSVIVVAPPTISKAFGATTVPVGGTTTLTFTLTNPPANTVAESGVAFSDALTGGLQVAGTPNLSNSCGGTFTGATAGNTALSLSGSAIPVGSSCTISLNVTGTTSGIVSNTTSAVSSTNGGTGVASNTATLVVASPPTISKAFQFSSMPVGATSVLTFTITNPNASLGLTGLTFSDTLTGGLQVASTPGVVDGCGGTFSATAGGTAVALSGGTVTAGGSCTIQVNVTGTLAGVVNNTTGVVSATESGPGTTSNTATITVVAPPTISKAFVPATIPLGNDSTLTFTIVNPNSASGLTGVAFNDALPSGLQVASAPDVTNTCNGTVTASAGSGTISLTGGTIIGGGSCAISVSVSATAANAYSNTTGAITSTEGGTGTPSNTATLTVVTPACYAPPSGMLDWWPAEGNGNDITGPNSLTLQGGAGFAAGEVGQAFNFVNPAGARARQFAQNTAPTGLPAGNSPRSIDLWFNTGTDLTSSPEAALVEYGTQSPEGVFGLIFSINAPGKLYFYGDNDDLPGVTTILPNTWYHAAVTYDGTNLALYLNGVLEASKATSSLNTLLDANGLTVGLRPGVSTWNGQIDEVEIFNRALSAAEVQSLYLAGSAGKCKSNATITKAFSPASIHVGGTSTLSFTINNPNAEVSLSGLAFSDSLPSGLQVAGTPNLTSTCGGTPAASGGSVGLSGGTLAPSSSCTLSVNVTSSTPGILNNITGPISTNEVGTGSPSNTATLSVVSPPTISKGFSPTSIAVNGTSTLSFTITNPNSSTGLTGLAFTDNLPAGLQVAGTPNAVDNCGGTFSAAVGSPSVSLSGGSVGASASCTISVSVTATTSGVMNNTTGAISSTEGGTGTTSNTATLTVASPATIAKSFSPTNIALGGNSTLSFTITNPNAGLSLTGLAFSDALPSGLQVASTPTATNTCGGTFTATSGATSVSLSGGTVASGSSCGLSVNITGTTAGVKNNTASAVTSNEGGTGATSNTATLTVVSPPTISKAFGAASIPLNGTTSLTFTINNPNATSALSGVGFSDSLPAGFVVASPSGLSSTCGGTTSAAGASISLSGGSVAAASSCALSINVTGTSVGIKNNTTGPVTSHEGGTGTTSNTATLTVVGPPTISKAFAASTLQLTFSTNLSFTVTNPAGNSAALTGIAFTDNLPAGLAVSNPSVVTGSCGGGAITAPANSSSITLSGATLAVGSACTFSVSVTGTADGAQVNTTGAVTSANGGTGNSATATITVTSAPLITLQPTNQTVCCDQTVTFTAAAVGVPTPTVQWQVSFDGGAHWFNIPGATSPTLTFPASALINGTEYRAVFTNSHGRATTNAATLTVNIAPEITLQPQDQHTRPGRKVTFTAAAIGRPTPTVQWQVSTNRGVTWSNIPGATSTTLSFTATASEDENQYRAVFKNTCGTKTTRGATLDVD